jgi:glycosyltransferase involved in cell wall biosynthesis
MKIIIAGPAYPYRGGIAEFSNRLAHQFIKEGHKVDIITFSLQYPKFLFPGKTQYTDAPAPRGLKISRLINSVNPFNWLKTGLQIKAEKPDILILRFWIPFMGPSLGSIARIVRTNHITRVICIFDNVIPHEKRPGDRILTKYFTGSVDGAIVMASTVGEELKLFSKKLSMKLNPHPLFDNYGEPVSKNHALSVLNLGHEYNYLLFFGFIRAYKGLDLLIRAFSDKRLRDKNLRLIIAGEFYDDPAPYKELVKESGIESEVIFFDRFIKDDEVPLFFSIADLVVQPYKTATQSGVTQIAFHYEKPMLVTDVGGLKEIVPDGKCGYVVQPKPEFIADAIFDFFENNRKNSFTEGVKREKEKYSWDKMTSSILEVFKNISPSLGSKK